MEEFHHFSHDHPLTVFLTKEVDDDIENQEAYLCNICGLPILSSPSYTCTINACKFFLHKPCATLPRKLRHPRHHDIRERTHILYLKQKSGSQNFTYQCGSCGFDIHPLLTVAVDIRSKHKSHPSHPLVAICRETSSLCDACGEKHIGFFFSCLECNFWIHQDCALLPSILKLASHPYPFILTYSITKNRELRYRPECIICRNSLLPDVGLYFCGQCESGAHVSCAKSNIENLGSETSLELIQLPADEGDTFPSLVISRFLESNPDDKILTVEKYHKHPNLKFHDHGFCSNSVEACNFVCDLCVQPINISSPFFRCLDCGFLAHNICGNRLPSSYFPTEGELLPIEAYLSPKPSEYFFNSVFPCYFCYRPCNGFCYYFNIGTIRGFLDLECMTIPNSIKHASHDQHVLFLSGRRSSDPILLKCCSNNSFFYDIYRCTHCNDFCIDARCASLPKRVRHKFDEHPLELIPDPSWKEEGQDHEYKYCFCEVCEQDIDQQYWYYGCGKCEHYFHINCIPSVRYLSKVKFGGTLDDNRIHSHPLILTRMLTVGRHKMCGYCKKIIKGFADEMAFQCSDCDFWIHFSCARDASCAADQTSTPLRLYSEVQKRIEGYLRNIKF